MPELKMTDQVAWHHNILMDHRNTGAWKCKTRKCRTQKWVRLKTAGDHRAPQKTPTPSPKNLSASRRRKNVFYRCQLTALTYSLTLHCYVFSYVLLPVRPSVCLSVCLLSVVCNARAPYSGGLNFRQYFYGFRYLGHLLTSNENFTEIVPGEPLRRGVKHEG